MIYLGRELTDEFLAKFEEIMAMDEEDITDEMLIDVCEKHAISRKEGWYEDLILAWQSFWNNNN